MNFGYPVQITTAKSRQEGDTAATYYRVVDETNAHWNEDGDLIASYPRLKMVEYPVARFTRMGASIRTGDSGAHDTRFVSNHTRKRFAWPTPELALADYVKRKTMQASILRKQANRCDEYKSMAEYELRKYQPQAQAS